MVREAERGRDDRRARDGHEHGGDPAGEPREKKQHQKRAGADGERGTLGTVEVLDELADLVAEAVGVGREAEELRELADDDRHREPVHVADLHFAREQVRDKPELADTERDLDQADEQCQHPREHDRRDPGRWSRATARGRRK